MSNKTKAVSAFVKNNNNNLILLSGLADQEEYKRQDDLPNSRKQNSPTYKVYHFFYSAAHFYFLYMCSLATLKC